MPTAMEAFEAWAPAGSRWSAWAKPILFATASAEAAVVSFPPIPETPWLPPVPRTTAVVVDLPGPLSVGVGLTLAQRGFRPAPVFCATDGKRAVVDVALIRNALFAYAQTPALTALPDDAPPAFLLDANRMKWPYSKRPGDFDNRSLVFPQDFPSGRFLSDAGIQSVLYIATLVRPEDDIAHVLRRWAETGLQMQYLSPSATTGVQPLNVPRPLHFRAAWRRALALLGLTRSSAGGFGSVIPTGGG